MNGLIVFGSNYQGDWVEDVEDIGVIIDVERLDNMSELIYEKLEEVFGEHVDKGKRNQDPNRYEIKVDVQILLYDTLPEIHLEIDLDYEKGNKVFKRAIQELEKVEPELKNELKGLEENVDKNYRRFKETEGECGFFNSYMENRHMDGVEEYIKGLGQGSETYKDVIESRNKYLTALENLYKKELENKNEEKLDIITDALGIKRE